MDEIWRDIPGYIGLYEASTYGRIRTKEGKTTSSRKFEKRVWKQRILKGRGNNKTTGKRVSLWKNGAVKDWLVSRLVATTFIDMLDQPKATVNHKDGNRFNNNIENLEWLSLGDNIRHGFKTGLYTHQKPITIRDKRMDKIIIFRSLSEASRYFNFNNGYMSGFIKKGLVENEIFEIL